MAYYEARGDLRRSLRFMCFSTLDIFSGYWQARLSEACKEKKTIVCRFGIYLFEVMPFGLMDSPSTFQRMMNQVLTGRRFVCVYLEDEVTFSKTV